MSHRAHRATIGVCFVLVGVLGLAVMLGWLLHSPALVQVHPTFSPMQFNTALAFVLAAIAGLAGHYRRWQLAAALTAGVLLLGSLTLIEYLAALDLGIDQLFVTPFTATKTSHPGRMAPNTALAFVLCGAALALRTVVHGRDGTATLIYPLLGATTASLGAVALVGYGLGLETAYGWSQYTRMALHTATAFVLMGGSLVLDAWARDREPGDTLLPTVAGVAVAALTLLLWGALETAQERTLDQATQLQGKAAAESLAKVLKGDLTALERMHRRIGTGESLQTWQADAAEYLRHMPALLALQLHSPRLAGAASPVTLGKPGQPGLPAEPCRTSAMKLRPLASRPQPATLYLFEMPLAPGQPQHSCLRALIDLRLALAEIGAGVHSLLLLDLADTGTPLKAGQGQGEFTVPFAAAGLRLRASATSTLAASYRSPLPVLFLVCGLLLAGSTSLSLAQLLRSRRQASALSEVAAELRAEIARRDAIQQHLQTANQRLDDFAYIASHDLKEPLRGLTSLAGFLLDDYGERLDEEGRQRLRALQAQARRMNGLIGDLLSYSRAGASSGHFDTVDLDALLSEVLERLGSGLQARGVQLQRGTGLGSARGNRTQLAMVFESLIDNAARYSDSQDRRVTIAVREGPPRSYMVTDNGIGIPEEHRERVFRMFTRLHHRDEYGSGSGAGLSIARKIVEAHGGRLWIESRPDGARGSVFCFTLGEHGMPPAAPAPANETYR
ncbi:MAG TPA: ATP-binding protein [Solimonas sp.]|nr:ATP-binding protein [Solimonas sp.]